MKWALVTSFLNFINFLLSCSILFLSLSIRRSEESNIHTMPFHFSYHFSISCCCCNFVQFIIFIELFCGYFLFGRFECPHHLSVGAPLHMFIWKNWQIQRVDGCEEEEEEWRMRPITQQILRAFANFCCNPIHHSDEGIFSGCRGPFL